MKFWPKEYLCKPDSSSRKLCPHIYGNSIPENLSAFVFHWDLSVHDHVVIECCLITVSTAQIMWSSIGDPSVLCTGRDCRWGASSPWCRQGQGSCAWDHANTSLPSSQTYTTTSSVLTDIVETSSEGHVCPSWLLDDMLILKYPWVCFLKIKIKLWPSFFCICWGDRGKLEWCTVPLIGHWEMLDIPRILREDIWKIPFNKTCCYYTWFPWDTWLHVALILI